MRRKRLVRRNDGAFYSKNGTLLLFLLCDSILLHNYTKCAEMELSLAAYFLFNKTSITA